jgi:hypothetical protein
VRTIKDKMSRATAPNIIRHYQAKLDEAERELSNARYAYTGGNA